MVEGFLLDQSYNRRFVTKWIEGKPEMSYVLGVKIGSREQLNDQSFRCTACGFLESYTCRS